ncbi:MAG: hypothetical protein IPJ30_10390 [Acidobacteria bacterium]|nr:hypothetical protein [Acidobacteriota bacterium]
MNPKPFSSTVAADLMTAKERNCTMHLRGFNFATAQFSQIVPKSIALRNLQVRAEPLTRCGVAVVYNGFAGTYNLEHGGANSAFGDDSVPYAPILSPDEKTSRHRIGRFASVTELFEETETIAP